MLCLMQLRTSWLGIFHLADKLYAMQRSSVIMDPLYDECPEMKHHKSDSFNVRYKKVNHMNLTALTLSLSSG